MRIILNNTTAIVVAVAFTMALVTVVPQYVSANTDTATSTQEVTVAENAPATVASLLATLQSLMAKVQELQAQIAAVRGEVQNLLGDDIRPGVSNDDVKKVQELLATDPSIYPEGLTTGYFGQLTKKAIERFQAKYDLEVTGEMDEKTKDLMESFLENDDDNDEDHVSKDLLKRLERTMQVSPTGCDKAKTLCLTPASMMDDSSENDMEDESRMDDDSVSDMMDNDSANDDIMSSDDDMKKNEKSDDLNKKESEDGDMMSTAPNMMN